MQYKNLFSLEGQVALVTGAAGILGRHFSRALAANGATVIVADQNPDVKSLSDELGEEFKVTSSSLCFDLTSPVAVKEAVREVVGRHGRVDILHNNAASKSSNLSSFFESTENYSLETWREVMAVNLDGMFLMAQAIGPMMVSQGGGSIIQTSSIYGIMGPDQRIYDGSFYLGQEINTPAVYSASKAGVVGLTKYLASLWGHKNVRVNTLIPGGVFSGQNDTFVKKYSNRVPLRRMANPEEMVGTLIFLASPASSYITGQTIIVDGGLSAW